MLNEKYRTRELQHRKDRKSPKIENQTLEEIKMKEWLPVTRSDQNQFIVHTEDFEITYKLNFFL